MRAVRGAVLRARLVLLLLGRGGRPGLVAARRRDVGGRRRLGGRWPQRQLREERDLLLERAELQLERPVARRVGRGDARVAGGGGGPLRGGGL